MTPSLLYFILCMETDHNQTDIMKTEADFLAQVDLAKAALKQFVKVINDPDFANADATKCGAMENLMKHVVCLSFYFPCLTLSKSPSFRSPDSLSSSITLHFRRSPPWAIKSSTTSAKLRTSSIPRSFTKLTDFVNASRTTSVLLVHRLLLLRLPLRDKVSSSFLVYPQLFT